MPLIIGDKIALASLLFGALSHQRLSLLSKTRDAENNPQLAQLEAYMHQTETVSITLICKEIARTKDVSDATLVAVLW
jgi:hypothetical protein